MKTNKNVKVVTSPHALATVRKFVPGVDVVLDAKNPLDIKVTPGDIKSAKSKKHGECAIAQACKRMFQIDSVIVSRKTAYLIAGVVAMRYQIPESAAREIVALDRGGAFEPGAYHLSVPEPSRRFGARKRATVNTPRPQRNKRKRHHVTAGIRALLSAKQGNSHAPFAA